MKALILVLTLFVAACQTPTMFSHAATPPPTSAPTVGVRDGGPLAPSCAELLARAQASPNVPVKGAFACINANLRAQLPRDFGVAIASDADIATYAATDPTYTHYASCGQSGSFWYFDLVDPIKGSHQGFRVAIDASEKASSIGFSPFTKSSSTCP